MKFSWNGSQPQEIMANVRYIQGWDSNPIICLSVYNKYNRKIEGTGKTFDDAFDELIFYYRKEEINNEK